MPRTANECTDHIPLTRLRVADGNVDSADAAGNDAWSTQWPGEDHTAGAAVSVSSSPLIHTSHRPEATNASHSGYHHGVHETSLTSPTTSTLPTLQPDVGARLPSEQHVAPHQSVDLYPPRDPATYTEFDRTYPPDRHGEEAGPSARVWRVYRDRVMELDENLIKGWNSTLDVLLIFAGLFSAVATAFIIEAAKQLQHDYSQYTAVGVFAILAALNNTVQAPVTLPNFDRVLITPRSRWINGLWFTSLALAMIDALLAILVKQWLVEYGSRVRGTAPDPRRWAWRHYAFREGLSRWGVGVLISSLAVLLHVALFFFLFGLMAFLFDLDRQLCAIGVALTALAGSFYLAATLAPLWFGDCPSITPLLMQARDLSHWLWDVAKRLFALRITPNLSSRFPAYHGDSLISGREGLRDAQILSWMIENLVTDADVSVAVDAIGSQDILAHREEFSQVSYDENPLSRVHVGHAIERRLGLMMDVMHDRGTTQEHAQLSLILRSWMFIRWPVDNETIGRILPFHQVKSFDVHILSEMLVDRGQSRSSGCSPDLCWTHAPTLRILREWQNSCHLGVSNSVQAIQPLTFELLLSDIAAGLEATSESHRTWFATFNVATISAVTQLTTIRGRSLKTIAHIGNMALSAHFADDKQIQSIWDNITQDSNDPWYVSAINIWGFAIAHRTALEISSESTTWLATGYNLFLHHACTRPRLSLQQVERSLGMFTSSNILHSEVKTVSAVMAARMLGGMRRGDEYWSDKLGGICFGAMMHMLRFDKRPERIGKIAESLVDMAWTLGPDLVDRLSRYPTVRAQIYDTPINVLVPRVHHGPSGVPSSTWDIAARVCTPDQLSLATRHLATELAIIAQLLANGFIRNEEDIDLARLLFELAGDDYGISVALNDTEHYADLAKHGKIISNGWWQQANEKIVRITQPASASTEGTDGPLGVEPEGPARGLWSLVHWMRGKSSEGVADGVALPMHSIPSS
ncbi:hypothetical protein BKA62DRAFT_834680 [Auriculariales sp. MPI-PUGE-AT-0066]|nr:hypothetical protein BKA62DRAFT_834680 [Auriculariales sp. MPI-PUGE-AT-0066]